jgi:hypothetical protein
MLAQKFNRLAAGGAFGVGVDLEHYFDLRRTRG